MLRRQPDLAPALLPMPGRTMRSAPPARELMASHESCDASHDAARREGMRKVMDWLRNKADKAVLA